MAFCSRSPVIIDIPSGRGDVFKLVKVMVMGYDDQKSYYRLR